MKKYFFIILMTASLVGCGAAQSSNAAAEKSSRFDYEHPDGEDSYLHTILDKETGCKYLYYNNHDNGVAMTPLLKADGTPDCGK